MPARRKRTPASRPGAIWPRAKKSAGRATPSAPKRYFPAWVTEEDSELVQAALKGLKDAGIEAPLSHFSFCTNGSSFCGEAGIPTIGYGPSLESLAHVRDEYIEIDQLLKSCKGFESILTQLTR